MRIKVLVIVLVVLGSGSVLANAVETTAQLAGLTRYQAPTFPVGLRGVMAGDGQVVLAFTIGADGKVIDSVALEATQVEFANAAAEAVADWQFAAAVASSPSPRREIVEFAFRRNGVVTTLQHMEAAHEGFNTTTTYAQVRTVKLSALDAEPSRIMALMPAVSRAQLSQQGQTPLIINFVIDMTGKVRVPVVTAADPALAQAVLKAVQQWRYAPPTHNAKPVLVEVTRLLVLENR
jgi:outer membrane biosynthesis protein TonB